MYKLKRLTHSELLNALKFKKLKIMLEKKQVL